MSTLSVVLTHCYCYCVRTTTGDCIDLSLYQRSEAHWQVLIPDAELWGLLDSPAVADSGYEMYREPTPFGFGLLADFITDHLDRLAAVATVRPETDPEPVLLLWRDWCRTQFERSQQ